MSYEKQIASCFSRADIPKYGHLIDIGEEADKEITGLKTHYKAMQNEASEIIKEKSKELEAKDNEIAELRDILGGFPETYETEYLDPTFYHTLNYNDEVKLAERLQGIRQLLKDRGIGNG